MNIAKTFLLLALMFYPFIQSNADIQVASKNTDSVNSLYKSARQQFLYFTPDGFNNSIKLYQDIINKDPGFAPAYSGLSEVYSYLGNYKLHIKEDYEEPTICSSSSDFTKKDC